MPSQICMKNSWHFINQQVNTPVSFGQLHIPDIGLPAGKLTFKNKHSNKKKTTGAFVIKPVPNLERDQVHIRDSYANSLEPFWQSNKTREACCRKYLDGFKKAIYAVELSESADLKDDDGERLTMAKLANFQDDATTGVVGISDSTKPACLELCMKMSQRYTDKIFNKSIAKLCTLHFANYECSNQEEHGIFCQRTRETTSLKNEAQGILEQCYKIGIASGACDGKAGIDYIVGSATKSPSTYCFRTATERDSILNSGGKTSFNKKLPFKVQASNAYLGGGAGEGGTCQRILVCTGKTH